MENDQKELDLDFYAFTMLRAWLENNDHETPAVMEAFCRKLPNNRKFFVFIGIAEIIEYLQNYKLTPEAIDFLCDNIKARTPNDEFRDYLENINLAKQIKIYSPEEGDIVFANEPFVRLEGPIGLINLVEKRILSILNSDIKRASKAARIFIAAQGKSLIEMGGRREASSLAQNTARLAYIVGFSATSNTLAAFKYGIPVRGTLAHSFIMSYETEPKAFKAWNNTFANSTYLTDTYDVYEGLDHAIKADPCLGGVRLDSGDLYAQSINYRRRINKTSNCNTKIVATNDLNEYKITKLNQKGAEIDVFGVGTEVISTPDTPSIGAVYKLVEIDGRPVCKFTAEGEKSTLPGRHQVYRHYMPVTNIFTNDVIEIDGAIQETDTCKAILKEHNLGVAYDSKEIVQKARAKFAQVLADMPDYLKTIPTDPKEEHPIAYPVELGAQLLEVKKECARKYKSNSIIPHS